MRDGLEGLCGTNVATVHRAVGAEVGVDGVVIDNTAENRSARLRRRRGRWLTR